MRFSLCVLPCLIGLTLASPVPVNVRERELAERKISVNSFLDLLFTYFPHIDGTVAAVADILTDFETLLVDVTGEKVTYNELGGPCTEYTLIFARGTTEPGNMGIFVGPPLITAITDLIGNEKLTSQGVNNYSASFDAYLAGGDPNGSAEMAKQIQQAYSQCPNTRLIVSGYSQGAQIVHNAAKLIPATVAKWISSAVMFGDPDNGTAVANVPASKTEVYCHVGDLVCKNEAIVLPPHITYGLDVAAAAAFIVTR